MDWYITLWLLAIVGALACVEVLPAILCKLITNEKSSKTKVGVSFLLLSLLVAAMFWCFVLPDGIGGDGAPLGLVIFLLVGWALALVYVIHVFVSK